MSVLFVLCFSWLYINGAAPRAAQCVQNDAKNGTQWIYIEFFDCSSIHKVNVNTVRAALARWVNEECATAIQCNLDSTMEAKNVLVGTVFCGTPNNFITFLVLRNASIHPSLRGNHLDLNIVGKVIQSREHLLSVLLHSDLKLVTIRMFSEQKERDSTSDGNSLFTHLYRAVVIFLLILFIVAFSIICFIQRSFMERKAVSPSHSLLALQLVRN